MGFDLVMNPVSGRMIRKGSVLHMRLIKLGMMTPEGPTPDSPQITVTDDPSKSEQPRDEDKIERLRIGNRSVKYRISKLK